MMMKFDAKFSELKLSFEAKFQEIEGSFDAKFGEIFVVSSEYIPEYVGSYEVIPKVTSQVLETKRKVMTDNLTIKAIPIYEVSNTAGGETFIIAKE